MRIRKSIPHISNYKGAGYEMGQPSQNVKNNNVENMTQVRELMQQAQAVNLGGENTEGIPIDYTTEFGSHYTGTVVFKRPTMQDYMRMGAYKAQYLGQGGAVNADLIDGTIKFMAQVMSTLRVVIVQAPAWLIEGGRISVEHIQEPDILYHLYMKYEEWELTFRKPVQSELQGDSQATE